MNKLIALIEENQADTLPAEEVQVAQAESQLRISFSPEYRTYLLDVGVISYESHETYGLGVKESSHLNIVTALNDFRSFNGFPSSLLPLADIGDGHYYMYDNASHKVLSIAIPDMGTREISNNLEEFICTLIFN
ncbi:SMI1/KNR4 family protein [Shewanella sp. 1CM18E]|uniref:SMI1/KNR4 family protein n=1 Tax=Shewanella sp. 1CM18E TaxID=2929169 RepID=UPI0020BF6290|nr:SMI1/KNR4 family protein [Shewanella sp. 1CM18E]MCK8045343.1 SMI1/KNR4 family protein [Shewanella sp. 1CM18E]